MQHWCRLRRLTNELLSSLWPWSFPRRSAQTCWHRMAGWFGSRKFAKQQVEVFFFGNLIWSIFWNWRDRWPKTVNWNHWGCNWLRCLSTGADIWHWCLSYMEVWLWLLKIRLPSYQRNRFGSWGAFPIIPDLCNYFGSHTQIILTTWCFRFSWCHNPFEGAPFAEGTRLCGMHRRAPAGPSTMEGLDLMQVWKRIFLFHWLICRCHAKGTELLQSFLVCALVRLENEDGKGFYNSVWRCPKFINI